MKDKRKHMDIYENIKTEENYNKLLKSGMFFEFHPELSGNWLTDKVVINTQPDD